MYDIREEQPEKKESSLGGILFCGALLAFLSFCMYIIYLDTNTPQELNNRIQSAKSDYIQTMQSACDGEALGTCMVMFIDSGSTRLEPTRFVYSGTTDLNTNMVHTASFRNLDSIPQEPLKKVYVKLTLVDDEVRSLEVIGSVMEIEKTAQKIRVEFADEHLLSFLYMED